MATKELDDILEIWGRRISASKRSARVAKIISIFSPLLLLSGGKIFESGLHGLAWVVWIFGACGALYGLYKNLNFNVDLSKLKGAAPFESDESLLLSGLHRDAALAQLKEAVRNENVAVVFFIGPKGVGKTSLIKAGLRNLILEKRKEPDPEYIYIEGNSPKLGDVIVAAVSAREKGRPRVSKMADVARSDTKKPQIIVIDDVATAENQDELIEWARLALEKTTSLRKLVFVLDYEEYNNIWHGRQWPTSRAHRHIFLERFEKSSVMDVARALADNANLRLPRWLLREVVAGASIYPEGRVSPLALSVIILFIGEFIGESGIRRFGMRDYSRFGYATGILGRIIEGHLRKLDQANAEALQEALARTVTAGANSFGVEDLGLAPALRDKILNVLIALSSPTVHVLRANQTKTQFTVLDEWIPSLMAWTGTPAEREVKNLSDYVARKFDWWSDWKKNRRGLTGRIGELFYFLRKMESSQARANPAALKLDERPELSLYVDASRRSARRGKAIAVIAFIGIALVIGVLGRGFFLGKLPKGSSKLPDDFAEHAGQLSELSVGCIAGDLKWVPPTLISLDVNCGAIKSLEGAPPGVVHLGITHSRIESLDGIPDGVRELDISSNSFLTKLAGLGRLRPTALDLSQVYVPDMKAIPDSVTILRLAEGRISDLDGLPRGLTTLELSGTTVESLKGLPNRLATLTLIQNSKLLTIDSLPTHLTTLRASLLPKNRAIIPSSLETLILDGAGSVADVPDVRDLVLSNSKVVGSFPGCLESLKFNDEGSAVLESLDKKPAVAFLRLAPSQMPHRLRYLKIQVANGLEFGSLPKTLFGLDLSDSTSLKSIKGLNLSLTELDISATDVPDVGDVPDSVLTLRYQGCSAEGLAKFPANLENLHLGQCRKLRSLSNLPKETLVTLDVHGTLLSSLPTDLPKVRFLDISDTQISGRLPKLPPGLEELILSRGQVRTLEGLPKSVKKLRFRDPD